MNLSKIKKFLSTKLFVLLLMNIASAVPLDTPFTPTTISESSKQWQIIAAKNAFDIGLFQLAEQLYTEALNQETNPNLQRVIGMQLASTLINQSKNAEAIEVLSGLSQKNDPEPQLLLAIASLSINPDLSKKIIDQISPKKLSPQYLPWFYVTKGLLAERNQNLKEARNLFLEATSLTTSENLKNHIDTLLFRTEIFSGKPSELLEKQLEKKIAKAPPPPLRYH